MKWALIPDDIKDFCDGYHTFNELYKHRYALFICLMHSHPSISWKSKLHDDGTMFENMFIAGMNLPTGNITYHLPIELYPKVNVKEYETAPKWDGHTSDDVIKRLSNWR